MSKDSREKATPKMEDGTAKLPGIPPEIGQLIETERRSVRIDPRRYFSKMFMAALPLIQHRLRESANTFTLEPMLFEEFMSGLRRLLAKKNDTAFAGFEPSDWIAFALLPIATGADVNQSSPDDYIDRESIWEDFALPRELNAPTAQQSSSSEERNSNTVSINVSYVSGDYNVVSLQISIIGEPVRTFLELEAGSKLPPGEKRALERRAKRTWDVLSEKITSRLGLKQLPAGRPITSTPQLAAFLRDHYGCTPLQMAKVLCREKQCKDLGRHTAECRDRLRKAADQHWKNEEKKYTELTRAAQHSAKGDSPSRN